MELIGFVSNALLEVGADMQQREALAQHDDGARDPGGPMLRITVRDPEEDEANNEDIDAMQES